VHLIGYDLKAKAGTFSASTTPLRSKIMPRGGDRKRTWMLLSLARVTNSS